MCLITVLMNVHFFGSKENDYYEWEWLTCSFIYSAQLYSAHYTLKKGIQGWFRRITQQYGDCVLAERINQRWSVSLDAILRINLITMNCKGTEVSWRIAHLFPFLTAKRSFFSLMHDRRPSAVSWGCDRIDTELEIRP